MRWHSVLLVSAVVASTHSCTMPGASSLPYHDRFREGSLAGWTPYGGSWQVVDGVVQNDSDDTGTKLIAGSSKLGDYRLDTEVQLLNSFGDAGVVLHAQRPEEGTDAFDGFYVGIRLPDLLIIGQMDFGYVLLKDVVIAGGVHPGLWYHLSATVRGCVVHAQVRSSSGELLADSVGRSDHCMTRGSFGLRSFQAGGAWRRVTVEDLP